PIRVPRLLRDSDEKVGPRVSRVTSAEGVAAEVVAVEERHDVLVLDVLDVESALEGMASFQPGDGIVELHDVRQHDTRFAGRRRDVVRALELEGRRAADAGQVRQTS